jgi:hypothetical protein
MESRDHKSLIVFRFCDILKQSFMALTLSRTRN